MIISFAGHSSITENGEITIELKKILVKYLAGEDFIHFYCGGYGDFDNLCAKVLMELKRDYNNFEVVYITPYITDSKKFESLSKSDLYDSTIYPPLENVPRRFAIIKRNEWMVSQSDLIIAYITHSYGGAAKTVGYARKKNKPLIILHM